MFGDGARTFREFAIREPVPLATIHDAVLDFLRDRDDAALYGAQAVNAYVAEPRMTQHVDLVSTRAEALADELREHLNVKFQIAVRVREAKEGIGFRLYQVQTPKNRHLVDLRQVAALPPNQRVEGVLVVTPVELVAGKVLSYSHRLGQPKAGTDWRDLAMLLLTFAELKSEEGPVLDRLRAADATAADLQVWRNLVAQEITPPNDDNDF